MPPILKTNVPRSALIAVCAVFCLASPVAGQAELPPMVSHMATYTLSLSRAAQLEGVRAASGKMTYTLIDRCDGYTIESDVDVNLSFSNGSSSQILKRYAGWESKDGRKATFRMQVYDNGELEDVYTGTVDLNEEGAGRAVYNGIETTAFDLPSGTMLSVAQLRALMRAGENAQAYIVQSVMDGAFEEGPYRVTGYVAPARSLATAGDDGLSITASSDARLITSTYWPVSLAYFPLEKEADVPAYEVNLQLLPNGIIRAMTQDYGSYTLALDLTGLAARTGGC